MTEFLSIFSHQHYSQIWVKDIERGKILKGCWHPKFSWKETRWNHYSATVLTLFSYCTALHEKKEKKNCQGRTISWRGLINSTEFTLWDFAIVWNLWPIFSFHYLPFWTRKPVTGVLCSSHYCVSGANNLFSSCIRVKMRRMCMDCIQILTHPWIR